MARNRGIRQVLEGALRLALWECLHRFARQGLTTPPTENEEGGTAVHDGVKCNGCKISPISGIHSLTTTHTLSILPLTFSGSGACFKCEVCKDFHFCATCYSSAPHYGGEHPFVARSPHTKRGLKRKLSVVQTDSFGSNFSHPNSAGYQQQPSATPTPTPTTATPTTYDQLGREDGQKEADANITTTSTPTATTNNSNKRPRGLPAPAPALKGVELGEKWKAQVDDIFSLFSKTAKKE